MLRIRKKASGKEAKKNSESHTFGGPKVKVQPFVKVAYISDRSTYDRMENFPSWYIENSEIVRPTPKCSTKRDKTVCHYSSISVLLVVSKLERN